MAIDYHLICGFSLGFEFVDADEEEDIPNAIVIDVFIVRFLIQW